MKVTELVLQLKRKINQAMMKKMKYMLMILISLLKCWNLLDLNKKIIMKKLDKYG